jgi:hypothetical protein
MPKMGGPQINSANWRITRLKKRLRFANCGKCGNLRTFDLQPYLFYNLGICDLQT